MRRLQTIARKLESWFAENQRDLPWRVTYDPWHIWVSEVMAQQTRLAVVLEYFPGFVERFPTIESLAGSSEEDVVAAWSGLGYYRRARMLHRGAREVVERWGGQLPADVENLSSIPGVGRYTAGAIASIAFETRVPVVDGNIARVASRLERIDEPIGSPALMDRAWTFAAELVKVAGSARALNQAVMEHGALVCTPRQPACGSCVVSGRCGAYRDGIVSELPRPRSGRKTERLVIPLLIVIDDRGRILLQKSSGPLMDGMYHLPHGNDLLLNGFGGERFVLGDKLGSFRHAVTHRAIEFEVVNATIRDKSAESRVEAGWFDPKALGVVAHPSYVRKALAIAGLIG